MPRSAVPSSECTECAKDLLDHVLDDAHRRLMHSSRGDSNTVGVGRRLLSLRQKQAVSLSLRKVCVKVGLLYIVLD